MKIKKRHLFIYLFIYFLSIQALGQEADFKGKTIEFPSMDNLQITADVYLTENKDAPFILLFHQAGWSRGAYREIGPQLNALGFNCMSIDQRSGNIVSQPLTTI